MTQDGHIVVVDYLNHCLKVLTAEGAFIATVGSEVSQPLQFNFPMGIAVHHKGKVHLYMLLILVTIMSRSSIRTLSTRTVLVAKELNLENSTVHMV